MKQSVTIIGAIEGSPDRKIEKEYLLMIRSLRKNGGIYADAPVCLLQPTENDISPHTLVELDKLGVTFIKDPIVPSNMGFLGMPLTCEYFSTKVDTIQMVWLDCDVMVLKEPKFTALYDHEVSAHYNMLDCDSFFNHKHKMAYIEDAEAQAFLERFLMGQRNPDYFKHINTWFVQAPVRSWMWKEWKKQTDLFVRLIHRNSRDLLQSEFVLYSGQGKDKKSLDYALSSSDGIAMGLLEMTGKYEFREPELTAHQFIGKETSLCHYDDFGLLKRLSKDPWVKENIKKIEKIYR